MKTKLLLLLITAFFLTNSYSQEQCGTMKNLEEQIKKDPSIKERMLQIEKQNQEWIEKNGRGFKKHIEIESNKNSIQLLNLL
jgi:low affinity Fe/Cu permease